MMTTLKHAPCRDARTKAYKVSSPGLTSHSHLSSKKDAEMPKSIDVELLAAWFLEWQSTGRRSRGLSSWWRWPRWRPVGADTDLNFAGESRPGWLGGRPERLGGEKGALTVLSLVGLWLSPEPSASILGPLGTSKRVVRGRWHPSILGGAPSIRASRLTRVQYGTLLAPCPV